MGIEKHCGESFLPSKANCKPHGKRPLSSWEYSARMANSPSTAIQKVRDSKIGNIIIKEKVWQSWTRYGTLTDELKVETDVDELRLEARLQPVPERLQDISSIEMTIRTQKPGSSFQEQGWVRNNQNRRNIERSRIIPEWLIVMVSWSYHNPIPFWLWLSRWHSWGEGKSDNLEDREIGLFQRSERVILGTS